MRLQSGTSQVGLGSVHSGTGTLELECDVGDLSGAGVGMTGLVSARPVSFNCVLVIFLLSVEESCFTLVFMDKDNDIYLPG